MSNLIGFSTQTAGKRQAILQGPLSSGFPSAIAATTGRNVQITASGTGAISCNFAAGFTAVGAPIDFQATYAGTQSFLLAANTTTYFYLERDVSTNAVTVGTTEIAPIYARTAPTSPSNGQQWFKKSEDSSPTQLGMTFYEWSGSLWVPRQRVFVGEATTNASTVTSLTNYTYNGQYESARISFSCPQFINLSHGMGMTLVEANALCQAYGYVDATDTNPIPLALEAPSTEYGVCPQNLGDRLNQNMSIRGSGVFYHGGGWVTAGQIKFFIQRGW